MRKTFLMMAVALGALTACEKVSLPVDDMGGVISNTQAGTKKFTFTVKGDFSGSKFTTRASSEYMKADGKEMTDMWVVDVMDGKVVQQLHQSPTDANWGTPTMELAYGTHHVMFAASRGQNPTLTGTELRWTKCLDTFFKDYEVTVVSTSNGNRAVTLDRAVTAMVLSIEDAVPSGMTSVQVKPSVWYDGIDLKTGTLLEAAEDKVASIAFIASDEGKSGFEMSFYWLAPVDEYDTEVEVSAMKGANVYSGVTIDGKFKANRKSEYHGSLFGSEGGSSVTLNATWLTSYDGGSWNE